MLLLFSCCKKLKNQAKRERLRDCLSSNLPSFSPKLSCQFSRRLSSSWNVLGYLLKSMEDQILVLILPLTLTHFHWLSQPRFNYRGLLLKSTWLTAYWSISFPEAAFLLVSTKDACFVSADLKRAWALGTTLLTDIVLNSSGSSLVYQAERWRPGQLEATGSPSFLFLCAFIIKSSQIRDEEQNCANKWYCKTSVWLTSRVTGADNDQRMTGWGS